MASSRSQEPRELIATGNEPRFYATHVAKTEKASATDTRLYLASEQDGVFYLEYTVVIPNERLAAMCRICAEVAQGPSDLLPGNILTAH